MPQILEKKLPASTPVPVLQHIKSDDLAFETFFRENFLGLCAYCQFKFGFDVDLAKEAAHTGFIKLWESRNLLSPELCAKAYLYKIITNVCYDILRHEKVKKRHEKYVLENNSSPTSNSDYDKAEFKELRSNVDNAVAALPEQMRKIFEMSRYDGLRYAEIASNMAISVKTVETQMGRALVKLRHKLAEYLPLTLMIMFLLF